MQTLRRQSADEPHIKVLGGEHKDIMKRFFQEDNMPSTKYLIILGFIYIGITDIKQENSALVIGCEYFNKLRVSDESSF